MKKQIKIFFTKLHNYLSCDYWALYDDQKVKLGIVDYIESNKPNKIDHYITIDDINVPVIKDDEIYKINVGNLSLQFIWKLHMEIQKNMNRNIYIES